MGYAMFALRESMLTRAINSLQLMVSVLSMRQQNLSYRSQGLIMNQGSTNAEKMLAVTQEKENRIEMQMKQLQTQLQAKQTELQSVIKAKEQAIKTSTPKFGLA